MANNQLDHLANERITVSICSTSSATMPTAIQLTTIQPYCGNIHASIHASIHDNTGLRAAQTTVSVPYNIRTNNDPHHMFNFFHTCTCANTRCNMSVHGSSNQATYMHPRRAVLLAGYTCLFSSYASIARHLHQLEKQQCITSHRQHRTATVRYKPYRTRQQSRSPNS